MMMTESIVIAEIDIEHLKIIRNNINRFLEHVSKSYATGKENLLLDIAPQDHGGAKPFFKEMTTIHTFDIDPTSGCTFIGDICKYNECLPEGSYDYIVCTEVLEHTKQPFNAVAEMWRILKPYGYLFLSVPFNFRIHGPLPDCWRFTEHGIRVLLEHYDVLELNVLETHNRELMPIHYTIVAQK
jgi:ubiquinone/menaquinone biosynthesis C-methylase UbiE